MKDSSTPIAPNAPVDATEVALQVAAALSELIPLVAPKASRARRRFRWELRQIARRIPADQWVVKAVYQGIARYL